MTLAAPGRRADPVIAVVRAAMTATLEGRDATLLEGTRWSVVPQLERALAIRPGRPGMGTQRADHRRDRHDRVAATRG